MNTAPALTQVQGAVDTKNKGPDFFHAVVSSLMLDILTACLAHRVHCLCNQTLNTLLTCHTALCVLAVYTVYLLHYFVCIIRLLQYAMCANYQLHIMYTNTLICRIILCVLVDTCLTSCIIV